MVEETSREVWYIRLCMLSTFLIVSMLLLVIIYVLQGGWEALSWRFLFSSWVHQDITLGGIFPAIVGTMLLGIGVFLFSVPIGFATAIYLQEYAQNTLFTRILIITIRNLAGVPSIIYGMFGLAFFVWLLDFGTSLLAASLTLMGMTLPWIISTSQEALQAVPFSFREGSFALGATQWQTIHKVVLPSSLSGMLTGSILGLSRAMGETAPIIMVGATFFMPYLPTSVFDKFMALPYHLFILATQHSSPYARQYALATGVVLMGLIFMMNVGVFALRYRLRKKKVW